MPKNDQMGMLENKKNSKPWKPPAWLEPAFIYIAFTVAAVASIALLLWLLVTFVVPFNLYTKETEEIVLTNGQTFQVKYPNLVLAGDVPASITLILVGESNVIDPATFTIVVPSGLVVVEPAEQAQSKNVELTTPDLGSLTTPTQMVIGVVNSNSVNGALLFARHSVEISSSNMPSPQKIGIGVEHIFWTSMRGIVNNTINEKSTLILLITGFLSGAGTLVLQYVKTYRDRLWESQKTREERFHKLLQDDYEGAISIFLQRSTRKQPQDDPDFKIYLNLIEASNWHSVLLTSTLEKLQKKEARKGTQTAEWLVSLCAVFRPNYNEDKYLFDSLYNFCNLALTMDRKQSKLLDEKDAENLLVASKYWQEELGSITTDLIQYFSSLSMKNLLLLKDILEKDDFGKTLLRKSNLQYVSNAFPLDDLREHGDTSLEEISSWLQWRPLWPGSERNPSAKVQRWLARYRLENKNFVLGSEYAELDRRLVEVVVHHPVMEQMDEPFPAITFGGEGVGKTAIALWLVKKYQDAAMSYGSHSRIFPVYAPFEAGLDTKSWLVEKISRALADFISDNPRRFLNAPDSQKNAMSRIMMNGINNVEVLHSSLASSSLSSVTGDIDRIINYITKLPHRLVEKLTNEETLRLLYLARPEGFDQIHFLWDIRGAVRQEDVFSGLKEIESLVLPLARQEVILKVFAPLIAKKELGKLVGFSFIQDIVWDDQLLKDLIEKRIEKLETLWARGTNDPGGLIVSAADSSPRRAIKLLHALLEYVDKYLEEKDQLTESIFNKIASSLTT